MGREKNSIRLMRKMLRGSALGIATIALVGLSSVEVHAQSTSYGPATDNVVINWGALQGAAAIVPSTGFQGVQVLPTQPRLDRSGLRFPGPSTPRSELHVAAPGGVTLQRPASAARPTQSAPPPAAVAVPAPAPAPAPAAQVASAPPAVTAPAPAPQPAPAPASPPATSAPPPPAPAASVASAPPPPPPAPAAPVASAPPPPPAPEAAPAAETASAPTAPEQATETAALPPANDDSQTQVIFNNDDTRLSADGQTALESVIAALEQSERLRVQLMAYAAGEDLTSSKARRISLSRALSVRSFLIEKGIRSTRIDVRALGDKADGDPKNRVDVNVIER